ncbi:MAG TPA: thermonuclease family protein [Candidatus Bathyarchaeia archaeon]|nr:thermonuclease family protein [Candidatus Bathyarchaeia archaeon]
MRKPLAASLLSLTIVAFMMTSSLTGVQASSSSQWELKTVGRVIDGDTLDLSSGDRVRLADINAPERNQTGYSEAKDYLAALVDGRTVYLDVDDKYTYDTTGTRLVCLIYLDFNSTHYLNVNEDLVVKGYALKRDYDNEFNPNTWTLFVPKTTLSDTPNDMAFLIILILILILSAILVVVIFLIRRKT